jgi:hypothetical protein
VRDEKRRPPVDHEDDRRAEHVEVEEGLLGPGRHQVEPPRPLDDLARPPGYELVLLCRVADLDEVEGVLAAGEGDHRPRAAAVLRAGAPCLSTA